MCCYSTYTRVLQFFTPTLSGKGRSLVGSENVTDYGHAPKKTQNTDAANERPLAQQNAASQYMSILHEVYSGIGARATVTSHRADYGYQGPP